jgi:acyl-homoserine lactone synthase
VVLGVSEVIAVLRAPFDASGSNLLRELFEKRYELFVEGRGWRALARPDRLDIDQYDDDQTTYFIKQIGGAIVGGARLRPTLLRHMLKDVFGDLCEGGGPPVGRKVYECSRTFVARRHPERRAIFAEVLLAVSEYCLENNVDTLTGVLETWWLNSYLALGLAATPLGMPHDVDGMSLLGVSFNIDAGVRDNLSKRLTQFRSAGAATRERRQHTLNAA